MAGEGHDIAKAANESLQPAYSLIHSYKEKPVSEKHGSNVTFKRCPKCFTRYTSSSTLPRILSPSRLTQHKLPLNILNHILLEFLFFPAKQRQSEPSSEKDIGRKKYVYTNWSNKEISHPTVCVRKIPFSFTIQEWAYLLENRWIQGNTNTRHINIRSL